MSATTLDYLGTKVKEELQAQHAQPLAPPDVSAKARATAQRIIAGVTCFDHTVVDDAAIARRLIIEQFWIDEKKLQEKLDAAGVKHLATWPAKAWAELCAQHPLFTIDTDAKGRMNVATGWFDNITNKVGYYLASTPLAAIVTGGTLGGVATLAVLGAGIVGGISALVVGCAVGYGAGRVAEIALVPFGTPRGDVLEFFEKRLVRKFFKQDHQAIIHALLPEKQTPAQSLTSVSIGLPEAPADVQENLVRAMHAKLPLKLHTVPEAISFAGDPVEEVMANRRKHYRMLDQAIATARENRALQRSLAADPIITVQHGSAVAIIAQYGAFPVEQALVDRVLHSNALV